MRYGRARCPWVSVFAGESLLSLPDGGVSIDAVWVGTLHRSDVGNKEVIFLPVLTSSVPVSLLLPSCVLRESPPSVAPSSSWIRSVLLSPREPSRGWSSCSPARIKNALSVTVLTPEFKPPRHKFPSAKGWTRQNIPLVK